MQRRFLEELDHTDPLAEYRTHFYLPESGAYFGGHSLGAMPKTIQAYFATVCNQQWGRDAVKAWNTADWINMPLHLGNQLAPLLGADPDEVIVCDSTSVNLFKLLAGVLQLQTGRHMIVTEADNFPADLYIAQGIAKFMPQVQVVYAQRDAIAQHLNQQTAVLLLTHVNFRTSEIHQMQQLTQLAHEQGVLVLWDLAHSAGVMSIDLNDCDVDFAVGCGYKYLNGGPGAPAFLFVAKRHQQNVASPLSGWMGHHSPFAFQNNYLPAGGIRKFLCGTPSVLAMTALSAGLDLLQDISLTQLRNKSQLLSELFISLMNEHCPRMQLVSPKHKEQRGSHIAYRHPDAYAISQALNAAQFTVDFRASDLIRFGLAPLYVRYTDVWDVVNALAKILKQRIYSHAIFQQRQVVS